MSSKNVHFPTVSIGVQSKQDMFRIGLKMRFLTGECWNICLNVKCSRTVNATVREHNGNTNIIHAHRHIDMSDHSGSGDIAFGFVLVIKHLIKSTVE